MEQKKFEALLLLLIPEVVCLIVENTNVMRLRQQKSFTAQKYIPCWNRKILRCGISAH